MDINQSVIHLSGRAICLSSELTPHPSSLPSEGALREMSVKTISTKYSSPSLPALMSLFLCFSNQYYSPSDSNRNKSKCIKWRIKSTLKSELPNTLHIGPKYKKTVWPKHPTAVAWHMRMSTCWWPMCVQILGHYLQLETPVHVHADRHHTVTTLLQICHQILHNIARTMNI